MDQQEAARGAASLRGEEPGTGSRLEQPVWLRESRSCARTCLFIYLHMPTSSGEDVGGQI